MNKYFIILLVLVVSVSNAQTVESISRKVAAEICTCISNPNTNSSPSIAYNYCEETTLQTIKTILSKEELEYLEDGNHMSSLKRGLFLKVNETCSTLQKMMSPSISPKLNTTSFPISFKEEQYLDIANYENQLVTIEGTIKEVIKFKEFPYFQIQTGDKIVLMNSAFSSGFETSGTRIKVMGYVAKIKPTDFLNKLQKGHTHQINVYGIVDLKTMDFAYYPGTEYKMSTWRNGTIPN